MRNADIVIIGGGIIGTSIAYQLVQRGATNVALLEGETLSFGSSGRATGGIRQQFADALDITFSRESVHFYEEFTKEQPTVPAAERPRFYQYGYLFLVTAPESWQAMQQHVALQQSLGVPTQLLTPREVQQRLPQLRVDDVLGAAFCPSDGYSDPGMMARALAYEAQARGLSIHEHCPVTGIVINHGRVEAVQTPEETFATPLVINATGAYSAFIARMAGIQDLPVRPLRRQLYQTAPFTELPQEVPMVVDLQSGFHFRRRGETMVVTIPLPESEEDERLSQQLAPQAFALTVDEHLWEAIQVQARRFCPVLAGAPIARTWSGLYEMTPDEHPVLGTTEIDGFLCACGFSGHGFMHAPMAAKLMTELILDGKSSSFDIQPFNIDRFRTGKLLETTHLL
jgi:sarcosine oxidase subunit beta